MSGSGERARQTPNSPSSIIFSLLFRIVTFRIEISGFHCQPCYYFILKNSISLSSLSSCRHVRPTFFLPLRVLLFILYISRQCNFLLLTYQINGLLCIRCNLIASIGFDLLAFVRVGSIARPFRMQFDIFQRQQKKNENASSQST